MFLLRLLWFLLFYVVCSCCGKDCKALGRHQWRCNKRMPINPGPNSAINTTMTEVKDPASIVETIKCCCGKTCKGVKGLKMHQRRCRNIEGLTGDQLEPENSNFDTNSSLDENLASDHVDCIPFAYQDTADTKPGVYLPKTSNQWAIANDFFKSTFVNIDFNLDNTDIGAILRLLNNSIYNYFNENYGTVRANVDKELVIKYREYSPR